MPEQVTKYVMNHTEAADFLGISERHLYRLVKDKIVPATKLGKNWKYVRPALEQWLEARINATTNGEAA